MEGLEKYERLEKYATVLSTCCDSVGPKFSTDENLPMRNGKVWKKPSMIATLISVRENTIGRVLCFMCFSERHCERGKHQKNV